MLSQEQIDSYREQGYVAVPNVLTSVELDDLRRVTDEFVEQSRHVTESNDVFDLEPNHSAETPRLRRLKLPSKQHPVYDKILRHQDILDMVAQLLGPAIFCNGQKLNLKSPGFGSPVEWHQDWAFYPHTNDNLLAVGVALDDMTRENGCLMVLPGSHKGKILNHHGDDYFVGAVTEPDFDDTNAVPVELPAGGISIHHVRTLHGSLPNVSSRQRRLLLFQYCAADAWPLLGHDGPIQDWESFCRSFVRGGPSQEPRLASVPVRLPLPMPPRTGSIYEIQTQLKHSTFRSTATSQE